MFIILPLSDCKNTCHLLNTGCYVHGCHRCFDPNGWNHYGFQHAEALQRTERRLKMLSEADQIISVERVWEHDWKEQLASDPELREWAAQWSKDNPPPLTINYRRCFRGKKLYGFTSLWIFILFFI